MGHGECNEISDACAGEAVRRAHSLYLEACTHATTHSSTHTIGVSTLVVWTLTDSVDTHMVSVGTHPLPSHSCHCSGSSRIYLSVCPLHLSLHLLSLIFPVLPAPTLPPSYHACRLDHWNILAGWNFHEVIQALTPISPTCFPHTVLAHVIKPHLSQICHLPHLL